MMQEAVKTSLLPNYESPPVVETILGVQFQRLVDFRNAHLGAFWKKLGASDWPRVVDAPLLPPQTERFDDQARWARGMQLQLTQDPSSRLQIKNRQGDRMIQVQNNRLHLNWVKTERGYPRYEPLREEFAQVLRQFVEFLRAEGCGNFRPNHWEVTYVNRIPKGTVWNGPCDWGFFQPLVGVPSVEGVIEAESFGGEWHFVIPDQRGRLHIHWQHALSRSQQEEPEFVRLKLTARGPLKEGCDAPLQRVFEGLDLGRETIVRSFQQLTSETANRYWRRNDGSD